MDIANISFEKSKLWTRDFIVGTLINFFLLMSYYIIAVIVTVYAMNKAGASLLEASIAVSIFIIAALFARIFCGAWIDCIGRKKSLITGLILCFVMVLFYFRPGNIWLIYLVRAIHGLAYGISSTAVGIIVTSCIPEKRRGEGIGFYMLSLTSAAAIGPFLGMFLLEDGNYNFIFGISVVSVFLGIASTLFLSGKEAEICDEHLQEIKKPKLSNFFSFEAIPICNVGAIAFICYSSLLAFLTPYSKEINLLGLASLFFIAFAVVNFLSRLFSGKVYDKKGENVVMYPSFFILMLGFLLLSQLHQFFYLIFAGAFIGLGMGIIQTCCLAIAIKKTPEHKIGLANSTYYIFADAGVGLGPVLFGLLVPLCGYRGLFFTAAIVALAGVWVYYQMHGRNCPVRQPDNALVYSEAISIEPNEPY